uniref:CUB domain-containing protein n=1 Tax=Anas platyrhynchos TaxID=8839 RepID=A0A8B9TA91_ANAPL
AQLSLFLGLLGILLALGGALLRFHPLGTLSSRNYPGTYPNHTACRWQLRAPPDTSLILVFGDLDLEPSDFSLFPSASLVVAPPGVAPCVPQGGGPPAPWHFGVCTLSPPQPVRLPPSRSPHPAVPKPYKYLGDGASVPPCAPQNPFWALLG